MTKPEPMDPEEAAEEISTGSQESDAPALTVLAFLLFVASTVTLHSSTGALVFAITVGVFLSVGITALVVSYKYDEASSRFFQAIGVALLGGDFKKNDPAAEGGMSKDKCRVVGKFGFAVAFFFCALFFGAVFSPKSNSDNLKVGSEEQKKVKSTNNQQKQTSASTTPHYTVSEIVSHFEDNEIDAESTYKNKTLDITGKVESINNSTVIAEKPKVSLKTDTWWGIDCKFDNKDKLRELSEGQKVRIRGHNTKIGKDITLENCSVIDIKTNTIDISGPYKVSEIVNDFNKNPGEAVNKYTDKALKIEGKVQSVSDNFLSGPLINFQVNNKSVLKGLRCYFDSKNQLVELSKGQVITVIGYRSSSENYSDKYEINLHQCKITKK